MTITLIPAGEPRSDGKQVYEPIAARIKRVSQYNEDSFELVDLQGFWQYKGTPPLQVGSSYVMSLSTKPKQGGRPGSRYMDIDGVAPLTAENCPEEFEVRYDNEGAAHGYALGAPATAAPVAEHPQPPESAPSGQPAPVPADSATHAEYTGAPWQTELPSWHTWNTRGIQKMSALKACVEWLNGEATAIPDSDQVVREAFPYAERLANMAWRLINELANGRPYPGPDSKPMLEADNPDHAAADAEADAAAAANAGAQP